MASTTALLSLAMISSAYFRAPKGYAKTAYQAPALQPGRRLECREPPRSVKIA